MPDTLFGVNVPEYTPVGVFPYDPDISFTRGRKWDTIIHSFSPLLQQRIIQDTEPAQTFQIAFSAMKGEFLEDGTKFRDIYLFYVNHRGGAIPFYYYDPVPWSRYPTAKNSTNKVPYRDNPAVRINHPGNLPGAEANFDSSTGLYVTLFSEDTMDFETFDRRLRKTGIKLRGFKVADPSGIVITPPPLPPPNTPGVIG